MWKREGRLDAGADEGPVHLADEWSSKNKGMGRKGRERDRCQPTLVKQKEKILTNQKKFNLDSTS